jgi:hypothetical protein
VVLCGISGKKINGGQPYTLFLARVPVEMWKPE